MNCPILDFRQGICDQRRPVAGGSEDDLLFQIFTLEKGLLAGLTSTVIGLLLLLVAVNQWRVHAFGPLDYAQTMR